MALTICGCQIFLYPIYLEMLGIKTWTLCIQNGCYSFSLEGKTVVISIHRVLYVKILPSLNRGDSGAKKNKIKCVHSWK